MKLPRKLVPRDPPFRNRVTGPLMVRLRLTPSDTVRWAAWLVVTDGFIQRYIHDLQAEFEDDDRIADGLFVLMELPVSSIPETEWQTSEDTVVRYAAMKTPFPPVVLDAELGFVDGGHRHAAAALRGDKTIRAFVPAAVARSLIS